MGRKDRTRASLRRSDGLRRHYALLALVLGVGVVNTVTLPGYFYPGDNIPPRAEAAHWLTTGQFGLPFSFKAEVPMLVEHRGQYFFENDARQRLYSKYGIANTVLYLPVLAAERLYSGQLQPRAHTKSLLFLLGMYGVVLTLIAVSYWYRIVALYSESELVRVGFVLATCYATYTWYYLRAPALEIFQLAAFAGFSYHALCFLRPAESAAQPAWRQLTLATLYAGVLLLLKPFFALVLATLGLFAICVGRPGEPLRKRLAANLGARLPQFLYCFAVPAALAVAIWLAINRYKFGAMFNLGYSQWLNQEGMPADRAGLTSLPEAASAFFIRPGNANVFVHNPMFLLGLVGWPWFLRRHRLEATFVLLLVLSNVVAVGCYSQWRGEWCYGPRYLVHVLVIGAIPLVGVWAWLSRLRHAVASWAGRLAIAGVLLWSLRLQVSMNSLYYFAYYEVRDLFEPIESPKIASYFYRSLSRGLIAEDLTQCARAGKPFYPLQVLEREGTAEEQARLPMLEKQVRLSARSNYFFFRE